MLNKFLKLTTLLLLMVAGVIGQSEKKPSSSDLTLAEINAFTDTESNTEQGNNGDRPPEWWNYAPNRVKHCDLKECTQTSTTDYSISVDGLTYSGDFIRKSQKYKVFIEIINCNDKQEGSWCDQRQVGAHIIRVESLEQGA